MGLATTPRLLKNIVTLSEGWAPFEIQSFAFSTSILTLAGLSFCNIGLYVPS